MSTGTAGATLTSKAALPTNRRYGVMALLAGMICINYLDRFNIAAAVPTIMKEFGFSPARMGLLMSAFGWTYLLCMFPVGHLLRRKSPKVVGFFSCLGWGLATLLTAAVSGFYSFFVVRLLLGATEAAGYPTCTRIASIWTPKHERTTATGIFDCSASIGSALSPMLVVWIILHWGWRYSFILTGFAALAFAFVWQRYYHDPDKDPKVSREELEYIRQGQGEDGKVAKAKEVPMYKLLTYRRIFAMCSGFFLYMYFATVFHVWIPAYLVHAKGFSLKAMGIAVTFPFLAGITVELTGARLLDKWLQRGASLTTVRRTGQLFSYFGTAICVFLAIAATTPTMTVVWLTVSYGIKAICGAQNWAIASEVAPRGQVGPVAALNGMSGALAVIVAPLVSGFLIQTRWGYNGALFVMAVALLVAGILYGMLDYKPVTLESASASTNQ